MGPSSSGQAASLLLPINYGGTHSECLPSHYGVGGGVPPSERLPHPPHLGPLEMRQRGGPNLTPPRSPHFEVGPTIGRHPHRRLGWVGWGERHSRPPPCPGPQLEGDRRLESPESWCSLKEHRRQEPEQEPSQPVHHGQLGRHHWGCYPQTAPNRVEPHSRRFTP